MWIKGYVSYATILDTEFMRLDENTTKVLKMLTEICKNVKILLNQM
mgnify:CR=1 FL=1